MRLGLVSVVLLGVALVAGFALLAANRQGQRSTKTTVPGKVTDAPGTLPPAKRADLELGEVLAQARVTPAVGGTVETSAGLRLTIPPGALDRPRTFKVIRATAPPPPLEMVSLVDDQRAPATVERAFQIDVGEERGALLRPVQVSYQIPDLEKRPRIVLPYMSVGGGPWRQVPYRQEGDRLVFEAQHFAGIEFLAFSCHPALVAALGVAAVVGLYTVGDRELPSILHKDAPFVSSGTLPGGRFSLWWSKKLPGLDKTGFVDAYAYRQALGAIYNKFGDYCQGGTNPECAKELRAARYQYQYTPEVALVADAVEAAQAYIDERKFKPPWVELPLYVVSGTGTATGLTVNPMFGRRYALFGATRNRNAMYRTALHEIFHLYQSAYVWWDSNSYVPLLEASATLLEREASGAYQSKHAVSLLDPESNNGWLNNLADGLDGPANVGDESAAQMHGYALSWFLEYLRDEKAPVDGDAFHPALLAQWASFYTAEHHQVLAWAAGGGEASLAGALDDFAVRFVIAGMLTATSFGRKYFPSDPAKMFGPVAWRELDLASQPIITLEDGAFRPWSIAFIRVAELAEPRQRVVVRVPRAWAPHAPGRAVVVGVGTDTNLSPARLVDAEAAPDAPGFAWLRLSGRDQRHLFVIDTGQAGRGLEPAKVFLLEPPSEIEGQVKITWKPTAAAGAGLVTHHIVYAAGTDKRLAIVGADEAEVELDPEKLKDEQGVQVTSAIKVGDDQYLESERGSSEPKLEGKWRIEGTITLAKLDASLQGFESAYQTNGLAPGEFADSKKEIEKGVLGRKQRLPDLDLGLMIGAMRWKTSQEGDYVKVSSPMADRPSSLGYSTYYVKLTSPTTLVGKMVSVARLGGKETRMEYRIEGTRIE